MPFSCFDCIKKTKDDDLRKPLHILYCFDCNKFFPTRKLYKKHMKKYHSNKI